MRQIILDTETTGLEPRQGHRIIEIGCVELLDRKLTGNHYHQYLQPDREIDAGAIEVHGITNEFLTDKPRFADIAEDFLTFIKGAELVIHNAPFDVGFIDNELSLLKYGKHIRDFCTILDTLVMSRERHPGQRNSLDALCKRYEIDSSQREKHGALLDAEILADVYLAMTGGQVSLSLGSIDEQQHTKGTEQILRIDPDRAALKVVKACAEELEKHTRYLDLINKSSHGACVWKAGE